MFANDALVCSFVSTAILIRLALPSHRCRCYVCVSVCARSFNDPNDILKTNRTWNLMPFSLFSFFYACSLFDWLCLSFLFSFLPFLFKYEKHVYFSCWCVVVIVGIRWHRKMPTCTRVHAKRVQFTFMFIFTDVARTRHHTIFRFAQLHTWRWRCRQWRQRRRRLEIKNNWTRSSDDKEKIRKAEKTIASAWNVLKSDFFFPLSARFCLFFERFSSSYSQRKWNGFS